MLMNTIIRTVLAAALVCGFAAAHAQWGGGFWNRPESGTAQPAQPVAPSGTPVAGAHETGAAKSSAKPAIEAKAVADQQAAASGLYITKPLD
jgi:hypothetical protein